MIDKPPGFGDFVATVFGVMLLLTLGAIVAASLVVIGVVIWNVMAEWWLILRLWFMLMYIVGCLLAATGLWGTK